ncbi:MAG: AAA family ATPase [Alkalispirochaeta sp.]
MSQLLDRVIRATQEPVYSVRYTTRSQLVYDIDLLLRYVPIAESRRPVVTALTDIVGTARRGVGGSLVVSGESGIGKTFLWQEFQRRHARADELWVYHKSPQVGESPFEGYGSILDQLIRATAAVVGGTAADLLVRLSQEESITGHGATVLYSILPAEVVGSRGARYGERSLSIASMAPSATMATAEALATTVHVVARWARSAGIQAVVIAVDDVQWADSQSLAVWRSVARQPESSAILFITRPERLKEDVAFQSISAVTVEPLTAEESQTLARAMLVPTGDADGAGSASVSVPMGVGSPFQIVQDAREMLQVRGLAGSVVPDDSAQESPSEATISRKLRGVSASAQAVIDAVALLFPPVPRVVAMSALDLSGEQLDCALNECAEAGILTSREDKITFSHDRLEQTARWAALHSGRWTGAAGRVLARRAAEGDHRATYVLARFLADPDPAAGAGREVPAELFLSRQECAFVLRSAAARAVDLVIASDAALFVEVAVERFGDVCVTDELTELMRIGHHAAFLQDDGYAMSHYYREIARYGTRQDLVAARQLWISRCYSKLWIRGALKIGKNILREHGVTDELTTDAARTFLRRLRPDRVYRRIITHPPDLRPESFLVGRTCAELFLTVMSIDHEAIYLFAVVLLRHGLAHGPTPYTALGFLFWAIAGELDAAKPHRRARVLEHARSMVETVPVSSISAGEAHRIRVLVGIIALPWGRLTPERYRHLLPLYREGLASGSFETSAHAIHVYCYAPLFHGYPLYDVYSTIEHYRAGVTARGLTRISRAMGKFAQTAWVLLGETDTPLAVTGHICSEEELERELRQTGDTLGLAGLRFLRALLAVYHGTPEQALDRLRAVDREPRTVRFLVDYTWNWFLHAMIAWRLGLISEAKAFSAALKIYSDSAPGNHRHAAVEAEHLLYRGLRRLAERRFRSAADLAVANGHMHDAALIVERHAYLLLDRAPGSAAALERLVAAEHLYIRWGVRRKADYLHSEIEAYRQRAGQVLEGVVTVGEEGDRAHTGEELVAAQEALSRTREYTRMLFSSVSEALLLVRADGVVLFHNAAASPYLVQTGHDQWSMGPELLQSIGAIYAGAGGEVEWHGRTLTYAVRSAAAGQTGEAFATVLRDITDERRRQQQMIVADRLSSLGLMAATVAHEVGNPNHIIALHGHALLEGEQRREVLEAAEGILEGSRRITEVVSLITRYGRDGTQGTAQWADPAEIGARVERFTRIMARQYTAHLEFVHQESVPLFWGYPALVEQALVNLVKNACEALTAREQRVRIEVGREDRFAVFRVADQGRGFAGTVNGLPSPGDSLFTTTKRESGGTGLGISVVRSVAERHGGSLIYTTGNEFATVAELRIPIDPA